MLEGDVFYFFASLEASPFRARADTPTANQAGGWGGVAEAECWPGLVRTAPLKSK